MNRLRVVTAATTLLVLVAASSRADEREPKPSFTPVQLALWSGVQLFSERRDVIGLRLDLGLGENDGVYGLDVGIANFARDAGGIEIGFYNSTENGFVGLQLAVLENRATAAGAVSWGLTVALVNIACHSRGITAGVVNLTSQKFAKGESYGLQAGAFNYATMTGGAQLGAINLSDELIGFQAGLFNGAGDWVGLQVGVVNWSGVKAQGLQVGLLNYAQSMRGVQLGLINIIKESPVEFLPVVNAHF